MAIKFQVKADLDKLIKLTKQIAGDQIPQCNGENTQ